MHLEIDRFAHLDSVVHRWDPRWKLVAFAGLMLAFALTGDATRSDPRLWRDFPPALAALGIAFGFLLISRIPVGAALRSLRPALVFFVFLFIVLPLSQGEGFPFLGPVKLSGKGLLMALLIFLRAFAILLLVFPMLSTSRFEDTMRALRELRLPAPLVQLIVFTYRYIFVFADEVHRLQVAWHARGFRMRFSLHALRTVGNGVGTLLIGSMERSQRIYQAMVCRGYSGSFRTIAAGSTRAADVLKTAVVLAMAAAFTAWRIRG
jgi:cobalt/nickel transport system permease protein